MNTLGMAQTSLAALRAKRKRIGVWLLSPNDVRSGLAASLAAELRLTCFDLTVGLLPQLTDTSPKPLGVFSPDDLADWLRYAAYNSASPIVTEGIEPLLATFSKPRALAFFRLVADLHVRSTVILATYLGALVYASDFPPDRTWSFTE